MEVRWWELLEFLPPRAEHSPKVFHMLLLCAAVVGWRDPERRVGSRGLKVASVVYMQAIMPTQEVEEACDQVLALEADQEAAFWLVHWDAAPPRGGTTVPAVALAVGYAGRACGSANGNGPAGCF